MTRLTMCLLASTALFAPSLAMADDPVRGLFNRAADAVRQSIVTADASGWRNDVRGDDARDGDDDRDDDDDDDDDNRGDDDDDGNDDSDDGEGSDD